MITSGKRAPSGKAAAVAGLALAAVVLAGCTAIPSYPLYTALSVAGTFGYSEQPISQTRFKVTYTAPVRRTYIYGGIQHKRDMEYLKGLAYDMALRRSAEVTLANGYKFFKVLQRNNDVQTEISHDYYWEPYYYDPFYYHHGHPYYRYPRYPYYPYYGDPYYRPYTLLAVKVTLLIEMRHTSSNGTFDAQATRQRVIRHYGNSVAPYPVGD